MEKKKGPAMTAPAPKSRGEWVRAMDEIIWQYEHGGFGNWIKSRDAILDSITALQSEVERVTEESKWCRCIVARGYENEKCRNCGLFAKNPFEKARQPK